ncbi:hypothetical protein BH23VER1_BH23VER1_00890 [soil metagenome]
MKKQLRYQRALLLALGLAALPAEARTWTSADDPTKTFDGDFVSQQGESVSVKMANGRTTTVPLAKLSEADREFVAEAAARAEMQEKLKDAAVPSELRSKLVKLSESGKRLARYDMEAERGIPEYYLFYYSASW